MTSLTGEQDGFIFCSREHTPQGLVMLEPVNKVLTNMIEVRKTKFIWIIMQDECNFNPHKVQLQLQIQINIFHSEIEAAEFINKSENQFTYILIYSAPQNQSISLLLRKIQVIGCIQICSGNVSEKMSVQPLVFIYGDSKIIGKVVNEEQLIKYLVNLKKNKIQERRLTNFISIKTDIENSNSLIKSMFAMLQQKDDVVRKQIVNNLGLLIKKLADFDDFFYNNRQKTARFLTQLAQSELTTLNAINWYTQHSPVFKLTNNILRSSRFPTQVYYIQPFFKDLFSAIQNLHQQQFNKLEKMQMICYRGGLISQNEFKMFQQNIGEVVQNLGFLSTSLDQQTAEDFMNNVIFQILIKQGQHQSTSRNYGYAKLQKYSNFYEQKQIIFTPLNSFKIEFISEKIVHYEKKYWINLQYVRLEKFGDKQEKDLKNQEIIYNKLQKKQLKIKNEIISQQSLFVFNQVFFTEGTYQYWSHYYQMSKKVIHKFKSLEALTDIHCLKGNFQKSIELAERLKKIAEQQAFPHILHAKSLNAIGKCYFYRNLFETAEKNFEKSFQVLKLLKNGINKERGDKIKEIQIKLTKYLTICYIHTISPEKSLQYSLESLKRIQQFDGWSDQQQICHLFSISNIYFTKGRHQLAMNYIDRISNILVRFYGENNIAFTKILISRAIMEYFMGRLDQSSKLVLKAQQIYHRKFLCCSEIFFRILKVKVYIHIGKIQYNQALELLQKGFCYLQSLNICQNNIYLAQIYNNVALICKHKNYLQLALQYFKKSLAITNKISKGNQKYNYLTIKYNISEVYGLLQRYKEAFQIQEECLQILGKIDKKSHSYASILNQMAMLFRTQKRYSEALQKYQQSRQIFLQLYGDSHIQNANILNNIGNIYLEMKRFEQSKLYYGESIRCHKKNLIKQHISLASVYKNLGILLTLEGDYAQALRKYGKSYLITLQYQNENPCKHIVSVENLIRTMIRLGCARAAEKLCWELVILERRCLLEVSLETKELVKVIEGRKRLEKKKRERLFSFKEFCNAC